MNLSTCFLLGDAMITESGSHLSSSTDRELRSEAAETPLCPLV